MDSLTGHTSSDSLEPRPLSETTSALLRMGSQRPRVTSSRRDEGADDRELKEEMSFPASLQSLAAPLEQAILADEDVGAAYTRFANVAFASPKTAAAGGRLLTHLFADQPGLLTSLVRTEDLLAELERGACDLTRMITLRWQARAMTQQIGRFAESLLQAQVRLKNPVAAEMQAAFAAMLALIKPAQAADLLQAASPYLRSPDNDELTADVNSWLDAGRLIESMAADDRVFWRQHLRHPDPETDWKDKEPASALRALADRISKDSECAPLFQEVVPEQWWARLRGPVAKKKPATANNLQQASPKKRGFFASDSLTFLTGQVLGMALIAGLWVMQPDLLPRLLGNARKQLPSPRELVAHISGGSAGKGESAPSGDTWRTDEIVRLSAEHPALKTWVSTAKDGTWASCGELIAGKHPTAYPTMEEYRVFLKWLMLDPPQNLEVRTAVAKLFIRVSTLPELIDMCEHLSYKGSPNAQDIPTLAQIAIDMHSGLLKSSEKERLEKLALLQ